MRRAGSRPVDGRKPGRRVAGSLAPVFVLLFLTFPGASRAQSTDAPPEPPAAGASAEPVDLELRAQLLAQWIDDFTRWERARDERLGRRRPPDVGPKPEPPVWLFDDCRDLLVDDTGLWTEACGLLVDWQDDPATHQIREERLAERTQAEAPTNSVWWQRLHLDAFWPMTQTGSSVYGIVGTHATVDVAGRWQIFIAPGAMLLTVPGPRGTRNWKLATDWGMAYRLTEFVFPGLRRPAVLHANFVTAWVFGGSSNAVPSRIALAGLSVTFGRTPGPP